MSLAGPMANVLVAVVLAILLQVLPFSTFNIWPGLTFLLVLQVWAVLFNLIPLPPLDGYGIIAPFLSPAIQVQMERIRGYAIWILILALWYIPFVGRSFSLIVSVISLALGADLSLAAQGRDFLLGFFKGLF